MGEYDIIGDEPLADPGKNPDGSPKVIPPAQELILGRFKTQDELVKAYKEAETKMTQESQKRGELERQLQEIQQKPPVAAKDDASDNLDELYWQKPIEATKKVVQSEVEGVMQRFLTPFVEDRYELAKENLRKTVPDFVKYETDIDNIIAKTPELKLKRGGVEGVYKMVKGYYMAQNPLDYEKEIREKIRLEAEGKVVNSLETPSGGERPSTTTTITLTDEERTVARKMYNDIPPEQADAKYADAKARRDRGEI